LSLNYYNTNIIRNTYQKSLVHVTGQMPQVSYDWTAATAKNAQSKDKAIWEVALEKNMKPEISCT
jgi:fumarate hydratase class II